MDKGHMFSLRYTAIVIGVQALLFIAVILVGSLWQGDALVMVLFVLYYPFIALAVMVGLEGMMQPFIAAVVVGIPVYGLVGGLILRRLRRGKRSG
jgi:hypothetical protein